MSIPPYLVPVNLGALERQNQRNAGDTFQSCSTSSMRVTTGIGSTKAVGRSLIREVIRHVVLVLAQRHHSQGFGITNHRPEDLFLGSCLY